MLLFVIKSFHVFVRDLNKLKKRIPVPIVNMPFYAVARGRTPGIFMTWADCEKQVKGFSGGKYKKFDSVNEAQDFIALHGENSVSQINAPSKNNQLKRTHTTANKRQNNSIPQISSNRQIHNSSYQSRQSDDKLEDSLTDMLTKQLDYVEKRVKANGKGIEKIINNATKGKIGTILIEPIPSKRQRKNEFEEDSNGYVQVYTDGACSSNGTKGARAGLGVYWGHDHHLNTSKPVSGRATNNCGEIQAASHAIRQAIQNGVTKLTINTDSKFLINSVTKWIPGWKQNGWKLKSGKPVKNEIDFKELDSLQHNLQIKWNYVEAHRGVEGNEMADKLAKAGAAMYNTE